LGVVDLFDNPETDRDDGVVVEHAGDNKKNPAVMTMMNSEWMDFSNFGSLRYRYKTKPILILPGKGQPAFR
jgi:hypothetical protein